MNAYNNFIRVLANDYEQILIKNKTTSFTLLQALSTLRKEYRLSMIDHHDALNIIAQLIELDTVSRFERSRGEGCLYYYNPNIDAMSNSRDKDNNDG